MSNNYLLIKRGPAKVHLVGSEGYHINNAGIKMLVTPDLERLLAYYLFQLESPGDFATVLRNVVKKDLTPMQIDGIIQSFRDMHPLTSMDHYSLSDLPEYADHEKGMVLPIPGYDCVISLEQERLLLDLLSKRPYREVVQDMAVWFRGFCSSYGLDYSKKCKGNEFRYLAESFLEQHGVNYRELPMEHLDTTAPAEKNSSGLQMWFYFVIWEACCGGLVGIGNNCDNNIIGVIIGGLGFIGIAAPFLLLQKFK